MTDDLITRLRELAEWADANEGEVPLGLSYNLRWLADRLHKSCFGKCERCVWRQNGGCSEWI